jgi:hypothetical protein
MRRPGRYSRSKGIPRLTRSGVLYFDVLGTKELANAANAQATLVHLDVALKRARQRSQLDEDWNWADSSWFSDNLAIAAPLRGSRIDEEGIVGTIIVGAMWLQFLLAIDGFFTRGGFTVGQHFMDRGVNFGPALVQAVELEKSANFPRIILDDAALAVVQDHAADYAADADSPFEAELMVDEDGTTFISYLAVAFEADDRDEAIDMLTRHRDAVRLKIEEHGDTGPVGGKYAWSANYHNAFCQAFDRRLRSLLLPAPADLRAFTMFSVESRLRDGPTARKKR